MNAAPAQVVLYAKLDGSIPLADWLRGLRDRTARQKIEIQIARIRTGNFGLHRNLGEALFELKVDCGPGYRLYGSRVGLAIVLLICGGDKRTQSADIQSARAYLDDYRRRAAAGRRS